MFRMNVMNNTTRLFSLPSFVEGVGRLVDFSYSLNQYNESATENEADFVALQSDWRAVGKDIEYALKEQKAG